MDDGRGGGARQTTSGAPSTAVGLSPVAKPRTRSLSDSEGTPSKLSPSPRIFEAARRTSQDDSNLKTLQGPVTPRRPNFSRPGGLSVHVPPRQSTPPPAAVSGMFAKPAPLSPLLDDSHSYASPTNILPRRSRGLDFSRAATSLHHSTLAGQSSPDSSPIMSGRAMNIPTRRDAFGGGPEQTSTSLWSMMGSQEKMNLSHSLGSGQAIGSDSSSSDDDDLMDEDMDDGFVTTPQVSRAGPAGAFGSPAMSSLMSFQQRQRNRKSFKKKGRGPIGLGFSASGTSSISNSPPSNSAAARRESISWQANQLHISSLEGDENGRPVTEADVMGSDGQRNVVRRPVTRRGNLLVSWAPPLRTGDVSTEDELNANTFDSPRPRILLVSEQHCSRKVPQQRPSSDGKQRSSNRCEKATSLASNLVGRHRLVPPKVLRRHYPLPTKSPWTTFQRTT